LTGERRALFWIGGLVLFAFLVHVLSAVLLPFVAGLAIAYLLDPVADRLEKWGAPRWLAATLIVGAFFAVVGVALVLLYPPLQAQVVGLAALLPGLIERLQAWAAPIIEHLKADLPPDAVEQLKAAAGAYAGTAVKWATGLVAGLWRGGVAVFSVLSLLIITPVVAFYMLRDWNLIVGRLDSYLPREAAPVIREQVKAIDRTIAGFLRGQASVCLVLAVWYAVGLTVVGLKFGLLVGLGAGLISFIPYVGATTGLLVGVGVALAQFGLAPTVLAVVAVFLVGQALESYVLTPRLVGERIGLHPVWIIFALLAGGALFGFTGILLAVPAAAVIGVLVRFGLGRYLASPLFKGGNERA
jgi:predicted PurR-regulated permease PerM